MNRASVLTNINNSQQRESQKDFIIRAQQEIINAQRIYIETLTKPLSTSDDHRWKYFLEAAIKRLDQEMKKTARAG